MKHTRLAGGPSAGHPFSPDFRVLVYERRCWSSSSASLRRAAIWEEGEERAPVGRKGTGKVPGKTELGRSKDLD